MLSDGGRLFLDVPGARTNATEVSGREHFIHEAGRPSYHGYLPTEGEIEDYALFAGFSRMEVEPYTTPTGRERALYVLRK